MTTVVAIVPAKDREDSVAATVEALAGLVAVDRVLVVDDGSSDATTERARAAGAQVLRLPTNRGKGGAVVAAADAAADADVFLLIDADLAATAGVADQLLAPVLAGDADMTIAVLPSAGGKGGFGKVRELAARGIRRATGRTMRAPLSGQRAVRAELLRDLADADRFGLEVALTIDAERAGARIVELDLDMDHRHTGRGVSGFRHRAGQGVDVVRALWPRVTSERTRFGAIAAVFLVVLGAAAWSSRGWVPSTSPLPGRPDKVVVFGMAPLGFADLGQGHTPTLDRLMGDGAVAAMSVRTVSRRPSLAEGYLSLGAGYRLTGRESAAEAYASSARLGTGTAAQVLSGRTGYPVNGDIAVVGASVTVDLNASSSLSSKPGALGEALEDAGRAGAVVGNGDQPDPIGGPTVVQRPASLAVMNKKLSVAHGAVQPDRLLLDDPLAPFGVRADPTKVMAALDAAGRQSDVIVVDPGDLQRVEAFKQAATIRAQNEARALALERTDALLAEVLEWAGDDTLVLVVSVAPPGASFRLTPFVITGAGVPAGYAFSPSTKRAGVIALTDVAPTVLESIGVPVPDGMPGHALRYDAGAVDMQVLRDHDRDTAFRERTYYPWAVWFIYFQAVVYLLGAFALSRRSRFRRSGPVLRYLVLGAAGFPLATFAFKAVPDSASLGPPAAAVVLLGFTAIIAWLAGRARRTPLSSLNGIMAVTLAVILVDACTGTWLHVDSWLGYSLHSAGRFYGIPNTTFAILASCAVLLAAARVHYATRRREALLAAALGFALVAVVDGAPSMGGDVGGIITLIPLFGLTWLGLTGRRFRVRSVLAVGLVTLGALVLAATLDSMRPVDAQTHLGRFVDELFDEGLGALGETFWRKQSANLRILQVSIWTWMIPIVAGFVLYLLAYERQLSDLLPQKSALRVGAIAVVSGALLGFLANDSGPIVIALFFVYLLPYIALLAVDHQKGPPVLLPPTGPPSGRSDDGSGPTADGTGLAVVPAADAADTR